MSNRLLQAAVIVTLAAAAAACSSEDPSTIVTPTPTETTDTFAGTLGVNGAVTFQFVGNRGNVTATLSSVTPDSTIQVGISLGTWNGITCSAVLSNDAALQGTSIFGTVNATGTLCVRIYDVGKVVDPLGFEIKVVHF